MTRTGTARGSRELGYRTEVIGRSGYDDRHDDYIGFLRPRLREAYRILEPTGSFFFHIDYREAHYCKVLLDEIFGRASCEAAARHARKPHVHVQVFLKNPLKD